MAKARGEIRQVEPASAGRSASTGLIERLKVCDGEAWQRLLDLYVPLVFSWCRTAGMQPQDSADVVQEVFQAVHRGIGAFRYAQPGDTFRGWLRTIARNKIRDHFRARGGHPVAAGGTDAQQRFLDVPAALSLSDQDADTNPLSGLLHRAMNLIRGEFEEATWRAFWLTAVEQQTSSEVARQLGTTAGAVRQAKYKVLRRLRQELGDAE